MDHHIGNEELVLAGDGTESKKTISNKIRKSNRNKCKITFADTTTVGTSLL